MTQCLGSDPSVNIMPSKIDGDLEWYLTPVGMDKMLPRAPPMVLGCCSLNDMAPVYHKAFEGRCQTVSRCVKRQGRPSAKTYQQQPTSGSLLPERRETAARKRPRRPPPPDAAADSA